MLEKASNTPDSRQSNGEVKKQYHLETNLPASGSKHYYSIKYYIKLLLLKY